MKKFDSITFDIKCLTQKLDNNFTTEFFTDLIEFMRNKGYSWAGESGQCDDLENGFYRLKEQIHFVNNDN